MTKVQLRFQETLRDADKYPNKRKLDKSIIGPTRVGLMVLIVVVRGTTGFGNGA